MVMEVSKIQGFSGEYAFLSTYYPSEITAYGLVFPTVENAYQAGKSNDPEVRKQFQHITPGAAYQLGREIQLQGQWDYMKLGIMLNLLRVKFSDPELKAKLLATGEACLESVSDGDIYWGIYRGVGQNNLGNLLMQVREELREPYTA
jgi:ribA/ribD-fused uncharacterized protein